MDSPLGRLLVKLNWSLRRHVAELQEQEWLQLQVVIFFSRNSRFQDSQMLKSEIANGNIFSSEFGFQDAKVGIRNCISKWQCFFLGILDSSFLKFWKS